MGANQIKVYTPNLLDSKNLEKGGGPSVLFEPTLLTLLELMQDQVKKVSPTKPLLMPSSQI